MSLIQTVIDLFFPPRCPFCLSLLKPGNTMGDGAQPWGRSNVSLERMLCSRCAADLPWLVHCCPRCARPLRVPGDDCLYCREHPVAFAYCCALGSYQGALRKTLHRFKYRGEKGLAVPLGRLLASRLTVTPWFAKVDALVPIPLSPQRQRTRGYNQAALLAQSLSRELGVPSQVLLRRTRDTDSQTSLGRHDRWDNIRGAFQENNREGNIKGRDFLLVDDILTSGATAHAASLALKEGGAAEVSVAVIAR